MKKLRARCFPLVLTLVAGACGSDPTDIVEGDALTEAEAAALAEVVAGTLFSTWEQSPGPITAPARVSGTVTVDDELPCEFGGTVAISGSLAFDVDEQSEDGTIVFEVTTVHDDCGVESEDGVAFVLNGAPDITAGFTIVSEGDDLSFAGGYDGAVAWQTDEKSGRCSVDVDFSLVGNLAAETGSASLTGRVCGITFEHSLELT